VSEVVREVDVRGGRGPARAAAPAESLDPREAGRSAVAREFLARLEQSGSVAASDGRRGVERLADGNFASAVEAFQNVLNQDAQNGSAAFLLGWALHGAGQSRDAVSAWRRAVYLTPTLTPAHLALVDLYMQLSQPALALQAARAGLTALPRSPELLDRLTKLEASRR
jgi:tetratricopeptide (TPR) repeat protein